MAKFAANLTMLFTEVPFLERFAQAATEGFRAVEFLSPYSYEPAEIAEQLQIHHLDLTVFNMPSGDWKAGERGMAAIPGRETEFRENLNKAMYYAISLNCKKLHALAGNMDPNLSREAHIATFVENIRYAADIAAEHQIDIMIEPLNSRDFPGYFLAHQLDALSLVQQIDRANVKIQFDIYHAQIMDGDLTRLIEQLGDNIGHVQIASVPNRHEPSEGELSYPHIMEVLHDIGYRGLIGCKYTPRHDTLYGLGWVKPYL